MSIDEEDQDLKGGYEYDQTEYNSEAYIEDRIRDLLFELEGMARILLAGHELMGKAMYLAPEPVRENDMREGITYLSEAYSIFCQDALACLRRDTTDVKIWFHVMTLGERLQLLTQSIDGGYKSVYKCWSCRKYPTFFEWAKPNYSALVGISAAVYFMFLQIEEFGEFKRSRKRTRQ